MLADLVAADGLARDRVATASTRACTVYNARGSLPQPLRAESACPCAPVLAHRWYVRGQLDLNNSRSLLATSLTPSHHHSSVATMATTAEIGAWPVEGHVDHDSWNAAINDMEALASHLRANMTTALLPLSARPSRNSMSSRSIGSHTFGGAPGSAGPVQPPLAAEATISVRPPPTGAQSKTSLRSRFSLLGDDSFVRDAPALPDSASPELLTQPLSNSFLANREQKDLIDSNRDVQSNDGHTSGREGLQATPLFKHSCPLTSTPNTSKSTINSHGGPLTPPSTQRSFHLEESQPLPKTAMHRLDGALHGLHDRTSRWWSSSRASIESGFRTSLEVRSPRDTQTRGRASFDVRPQALRPTLRPSLLSRRSEDFGERRDWGSFFPLYSKSTKQRGLQVRSSVDSPSVLPALLVPSSNLSPALERYELKEEDEEIEDAEDEEEAEEDLNDLLSLLMAANRDFDKHPVQPPALQRLDILPLNSSEPQQVHLDRLRPTSKVTSLPQRKKSAVTFDTPDARQLDLLLDNVTNTAHRSMNDQGVKPPPRPSRAPIALPASPASGSNDSYGPEKRTEPSKSKFKDHHTHAARSHLERSLRNFGQSFKLKPLDKRFTNPWRRFEATPSKIKPAAQPKKVERRINNMLSRLR